MAQHNPQSRGYLLIVLVAIVVCFVIALFVLGGGDDTHTATDQDGGHEAQTSEPAAEVPMEGMSVDETPPRDQMNGADGMMDDMSPPDEMIDEPMLDEAPAEAPDTAPPAEMPEEPAAETPPPAENP